MITELFIEGEQADVSADISSLLTFALDDIKEFGTRQTSWSKTVVVPGTSRNNRLFGGIFEIGVSNPYDPNLPNINTNFNASVAARCLLFQDNLQAFKGTIRMLQIVSDKERVEYEVALNGELTSLNVKLSGAFLDQLDFSAYNQFWNAANVVASWDNPGGSGIYYPMVDYGNYSTLKHDWDLRTFRPALYVKEYIDKMFAAAGARYSCSLFNTARFKSLIIPDNQKILYNKEVTALNIIKTGNDVFPDSANMPFNAQPILGGFTASVGNTIFTYSGAPINGFITFRTQVLDHNSISPPFILKLMLNNVMISSALANGLTFPYFIDLPTVNVTINSGDTLRLYIEEPVAGSFRYIELGTSVLTVTNSSKQPVQVNPNELIKINGAIPNNIRQIDFLTSIVKLFNLYIYEDQFDENLFYIKPYVDFYSEDSGNAVDWTYKVNRDAVIKVKPMSELTSKTYNFSYKSDTDYWNDLYKKRYNQVYGTHIFDSNFEFASQENKLELIFAPTVLVGYGSEDKVYSTIYKRNGIVEEQQDHVIRILQTKKVTGVTSWSIKDGVSTLSSQTTYGYAGHFDDPDNPTNDLNYGVLKELFFTLVTGNLTVTQFNVYWSPYMAEITDKDSKMLTCRAYLTPKDIAALDFSKYVHIDGVIYRLMSIVDYNASSPNDCEINLLKVINTLY